MINLKLKTIASFVSTRDTVLDTCTDHAYLAIYLKQKHLCKDVYASDINPNALDVAKKNIVAADLNITTYLSDGFKNIKNKDIDTAIIAGVGTNTVLDIIDGAPSNINKYIISSNNNQGELRFSLCHKGLYIQKETVVLDKGKYYVIMLVTKDYIKENKLSLKYGKSNNQDYFLYLIKKEQDVLARIPKNKLIKRFIHKRNIKYLKRIIKKI